MYNKGWYHGHGTAGPRGGLECGGPVPGRDEVTIQVAVGNWYGKPRNGGSSVSAGG